MKQEIEKKNGYVCPDELKPYWRADSCMEVKTTCGQIAIVCNEIQSTVFIGSQAEVNQFKYDNNIMQQRRDYWPELEN